MQSNNENVIEEEKTWEPNSYDSNLYCLKYNEFKIEKLPAYL